MDSTEHPRRPFTRGRKRAAEDEQARRQEEEVKKWRQATFRTSGRSDTVATLGGANVIILNANVSRIQVEEETDSIPGIKTETPRNEGEMEVEPSTSGGPHQFPVSEEILHEDDLRGGQESAGAKETERIHSGEAVIDLTGETVGPELEPMSTIFRSILSGKSKEEIQSLVDTGEHWQHKNDEGDSLLHVAARCGNHLVLKYFISIGAEVNARNSVRSTPLMEATKSKNFSKVVDVLLRNGADLEATNLAGENAFFLGLETDKNVKALEKLCSGCYFSVINRRTGDTVLHKAVKCGNLEALKYFMTWKPFVNVRNYQGWTPMMSAISLEENFWPVVSLLQRNGANINSLDWKERGLLWYAIDKKKPMADLEKLVNAGALWDKKSVIFQCIENGHVEALEYFVGKGANLNAVNCWGWTPLLEASSKGLFEVVSILVADGKSSLKGHHNQRYVSPPKEACKKFSKMRMSWNEIVLHRNVVDRDLEGARSCVSNGADVNAKDDKGETPLFKAVKTKHMEMLKYLVEVGGNVNEVNMEGFSLLHLAISHSHTLKTLKTFISLGATWSNGVVGNWERTESILHAAVTGGRAEVVQFFISKGVNVNCKDYHGYTPLLLAARIAAGEEILRVLMNGGADLNAVDDCGNNAVLLGVRGAVIRNDETEYTLSRMKMLVGFGCNWKTPNESGQTVLSYLEKYGDTELLEYFRKLD